MIVKTCEKAGSPQHTERLTNIDGLWLPEKTYTRQLEIQSNIATESVAAVKAAGGVALGDTYAGPGGETDTEARCNSIVPVKDTRAPQKWVLTLNYTTNYQTQNPFEQVFEYGTLERPVAFELDFSAPDRKPVVNGAKDPFDPLPEIAEYDVTIQVQRLNALGTIDVPNLRKSFMGTTNAAAVNWDGFTWGAKELVFNDIRVRPRYVAGVKYLDTVYYFLARWRDDLQAGQGHHDAFLLNWGFNQIVDDGGFPPVLTKEPILDEKTNQPIGGNLDENGALLGVDDDPEYLHFVKAKPADYSTFPFV